MVDFNKLNTIDDWEALGINTNPISSKDYTVYDLLKMRDILRGLRDTTEYSKEPDSDYTRILWLLDGIHNALSSRTQNTAFWEGDKNLNPWTSKAEEYDKDHFGEEQAADLKKEFGTGGTDANKPDTKDTGLSEQERWLIEALRDDPHDDRWED